MDDIEVLCRIICKASGINPDQESVGLGKIIPEGKPYKLWEAQVDVAQAIFDYLHSKE